ncbi:NAD(P)-dependent alcohol dehydrogenase [Marinoscillum sp.]|uniref:NAD(P)-dependent alcohol dehydrogenase n=1 Tax=Marinoscillum sp. TaxID=2024838 RepID=UPI003BA9C146
MKAIVYEQYGGPEQMMLREIERPNPGPKEVLVKILAASVNKADWHLLTGEPFPIRMMAGMFRPKYKTLGADVVGVVERVGAEVSQFKVGDEVFGELSATGFGGFAEYVTTDESHLARKPSNLTYEETAALPMAAVTALQGLRSKGGIRKDQKVLINGASGGVGGFAIQIAKYFDAEVTAVCSTSKVELAWNQGADRILDYKEFDFTEGKSRYDLIFDVVGNHSIRAISGVLKDGGTYVSCAFSMGALFLGPWLSLANGKKFTNLMASTTSADLQTISKMAEEGFIKPVIQQIFTLDDVPEALGVIGDGSAEGKLVISI